MSSQDVCARSIFTCKSVRSMYTVARLHERYASQLKFHKAPDGHWLVLALRRRFRLGRCATKSAQRPQLVRRREVMEERAGDSDLRSTGVALRAASHGVECALRAGDLAGRSAQPSPSHALEASKDQTARHALELHACLHEQMARAVWSAKRLPRQRTGPRLRCVDRCCVPRC